MTDDELKADLKDMASAPVMCRPTMLADAALAKIVALEADLAAARQERDTLRQTNKELHRRVQAAESEAMSPADRKVLAIRTRVLEETERERDTLRQELSERTKRQNDRLANTELDLYSQINALEERAEKAEAAVASWQRDYEQMESAWRDRKEACEKAEAERNQLRKDIAFKDQCEDMLYREILSIAGVADPEPIDGRRQYYGWRPASKKAKERIAAAERAAAESAVKYQNLLAAVKVHFHQKADDRCIEDDDRLYAAAGLTGCDRRVGDKFAMLKNCARFIENRCQGGGWPSYAELEAKLAESAKEVERLTNQVAALRALRTHCSCGVAFESGDRCKMCWALVQGTRADELAAEVKRLKAAVNQQAHEADLWMIRAESDAARLAACQEVLRSVERRVDGICVSCHHGPRVPHHFPDCRLASCLQPEAVQSPSAAPAEQTSNPPSTGVFEQACSHCGRFPPWCVCPPKPAAPTEQKGGENASEFQAAGLEAKATHSPLPSPAERIAAESAARLAACQDAMREALQLLYPKEMQEAADRLASCLQPEAVQSHNEPKGGDVQCNAESAVVSTTTETARQQSCSDRNREEEAVALLRKASHNHDGMFEVCKEIAAFLARCEAEQKETKP